MTPDQINAVFEAGLALLLLLNVRRLYLARSSSGIALAPTLWFMAWGGWGFDFYCEIGWRLSAFAGALILAVNSAWVILALYYRYRRLPS